MNKLKLIVIGAGVLFAFLSGGMFILVISAMITKSMFPWNILWGFFCLILYSVAGSVYSMPYIEQFFKAIMEKEG
ncbi:MAG: hypothetical protein KAS32_30300 [Candidatus Peribacteraceae bacterium]|nr:hypothetical protein [Candidatus Peribacteraceae bacterium]